MPHWPDWRAFAACRCCALDRLCDSTTSGTKHASNTRWAGPGMHRARIKRPVCCRCWGCRDPRPRTPHRRPGRQGENPQLLPCWCAFLLFCCVRCELEPQLNSAACSVPTTIIINTRTPSLITLSVKKSPQVSILKILCKTDLAAKASDYTVILTRGCQGIIT